MDAAHLDRLARSLVSRRAGLGLALGGLLGVASAATETAAGRNCGACKKRVKDRCKPKKNGTPCGSGKTCRGGKCKPAGQCDRNETVCGQFCCTADQFCQGGFCVACGGFTEPCCPGGICDAGLACAGGALCGPPPPM